MGSDCPTLAALWLLGTKRPVPDVTRPPALGTAHTDLQRVLSVATRDRAQGSGHDAVVRPSRARWAESPQPAMVAKLAASPDLRWRHASLRGTQASHWPTGLG